ncbi:MAG TPA: nitronate monooxygenase [Polyangiales bacterium]|nr:nitronate monooxygenase [Polyangiales bacterium]
MPAVSDFLARLRLELPVVQAALGGANSNAELAASVAEAGGLGGVGMRSPRGLTEQLKRARALAPRGRLAGGLLLRQTRRAHVDALIAGQPDAVILMDGFAPDVVRRLRDASIYVIHQVGSRADAERALRDGADALIAQGVESGGHVLGAERGTALLPQVLEVAQGKPVLLAGGIVDRQDVQRALERGAAAAVAGSRYLLTHESTAHAAYKQRILGAGRTILTQLFGLGWALKHRVVPNAATARWCDAEGRIPPWLDEVQRRTEPVIAPFAFLRDEYPVRKGTAVPLFSPASLIHGQPEAGVETTALYAGESVARIHAIEHAYDITRRLGGRSDSRTAASGGE